MLAVALQSNIVVIREAAEHGMWILVPFERLDTQPEVLSEDELPNLSAKCL
jgi:hypothetical protein